MGVHGSSYVTPESDGQSRTISNDGIHRIIENEVIDIITYTAKLDSGPLFNDKVGVFVAITSSRKLHIIGRVLSSIDNLLSVV